MTPKADSGKITGKTLFFQDEGGLLSLFVHGNAGFVDKVVFQVCFVHQETDFVEKSVNCIKNSGFRGV